MVLCDLDAIVADLFDGDAVLGRFGHLLGFLEEGGVFGDHFGDCVGIDCETHLRSISWNG